MPKSPAYAPASHPPKKPFRVFRVFRGFKKSRAYFLSAVSIRDSAHPQKNLFVYFVYFVVSKKSRAYFLSVARIRASAISSFISHLSSFIVKISSVRGGIFTTAICNFASGGVCYNRLSVPRRRVRAIEIVANHHDTPKTAARKTRVSRSVCNRLYNIYRGAVKEWL